MENQGLECLDYGLSFVCNKASFNAVRFWIESKTTLIDQHSGTAQLFYQCGSCKSENTFGKENLFYEDNYDFLPILGGKDWLLFRRHNRVTDRYREIKPSVWGEYTLKLRYGKNVTLLETFEQIRDLTAAGNPIVAQTEIENQETGLKAILEYPVKTMNISAELSMYQVDTGPVALPDLRQRYDHPMESLNLAYVAFNAEHFADFVVEQPTPVMEEDQEVAKVYHYSNPSSLPARNRLYALGLD